MLWEDACNPTKAGDEEADEEDDSNANGLVYGLAVVRVELHGQQDGYNHLGDYHLHSALQEQHLPPHVQATVSAYITA